MIDRFMQQMEKDIHKSMSVLGMTNEDLKDHGTFMLVVQMAGIQPHDLDYYLRCLGVTTPIY